MKNYLDKATENKNISATHDTVQRRNNSTAFHLTDNRTNTTAIKKALAPLNNNASLAQLAAVGPVVQLGKDSKKRAATERNANKKAKEQSQGDRSYNNICAYRPGWVRMNDITADKVAAFRKTYKNGIRGHASGDNNQGEQENTKTDCLAYKSWHTKTYGEWH